MPTNSIEYKDDGIYYNGKLVPNISSQTEKTSLDDNDVILLEDSSDSNNKKKITKSNFTSSLVAGTDGQVQFNDSGSFGATTNLTTDGTDVTLLDAGKLKIGTGGDGEIFSSADDLYIKNTTLDKDIIFKVNKGGVDTEVMRMQGSTGTFYGFNPTFLSPPGGTNEFSIRTEGAVNQRFSLYRQSDTAIDYLKISKNFTIATINASDNLDLQTGDTSRVRILGNGRVGIGTTNPQYLLHVVSTYSSGSMRFDEDGSGNSVLSLYNSTSDKSWQLKAYTGGNFSVYDTSSLADRIVIDSNGSVSLPEVYADTVGATNRDLFIDSTGKLGYVVSSERYKENIQDLTDTDWLHNLRPVTFDYIDREQGTDKTGLIAEEVEKVNPKLVSYNENNQPETVLYSELVTPLLKEIQNLRSENQNLKKEQKDILARIEQLENK